MMLMKGIYVLCRKAMTNNNSGSTVFFLLSRVSYFPLNFSKLFYWYTNCISKIALFTLYFISSIPDSVILFHLHILFQPILPAFTATSPPFCFLIIPMQLLQYTLPFFQHPLAPFIRINITSHCFQISLNPSMGFIKRLHKTVHITRTSPGYCLIQESTLFSPFFQ